jgi:hypothetical protein
MNGARRSVRLMKKAVQPLGKKYFALDILLIRSSVGRPAPLKRGASRSSRTLGRDAMDAAASGAFCARRLRLTRTAEGIWLNLVVTAACSFVLQADHGLRPPPGMPLRPRFRRVALAKLGRQIAPREYEALSSLLFDIQFRNDRFSAAVIACVRRHASREQRNPSLSPTRATRISQTGP